MLKILIEKCANGSKDAKRLRKGAQTLIHKIPKKGEKLRNRDYFRAKLMILTLSNLLVTPTNCQTANLTLTRSPSQICTTSIYAFTSKGHILCLLPNREEMMFQTTTSATKSFKPNNTLNLNKTEVESIECFKTGSQRCMMATKYRVFFLNMSNVRGVNILSEFSTNSPKNSSNSSELKYIVGVSLMEPLEQTELVLLGGDTLTGLVRVDFTERANFSWMDLGKKEPAGKQERTPLELIHHFRPTLYFCYAVRGRGELFLADLTKLELVSSYGLISGVSLGSAPPVFVVDVSRYLLSDQLVVVASTELKIVNFASGLTLQSYTDVDIPGAIGGLKGLVGFPMTSFIAALTGNSLRIFEIFPKGPKFVELAETVIKESPADRLGFNYAKGALILEEGYFVTEVALKKVPGSTKPLRCGSACKTCSVAFSVRSLTHCNECLPQAVFRDQYCAEPLPDAIYGGAWSPETLESNFTADIAPSNPIIGGPGQFLRRVSEEITIWFLAVVVVCIVAIACLGSVSDFKFLNCHFFRLF